LGPVPIHTTVGCGVATEQLRETGQGAARKLGRWERPHATVRDIQPHAYDAPARNRTPPQSSAHQARAKRMFR